MITVSLDIVWSIISETLYYMVPYCYYDKWKEIYLLWNILNSDTCMSIISVMWFSWLLVKKMWFHCVNTKCTIKLCTINYVL